MTADLIELLGTCAPEERRGVALELGRTGTDAAVAEPTRRAYGVKQYGHRSWQRLWTRKPTEFYELEDQLTDVEALAETGSKEALRCLDRIMYHKIVDRKTRGWVQGIDLQAQQTSGTIVFPRVKGPLSKALKCRYAEGFDEKGDYRYDEQENPVYCRVKGAADMLRLAIQSASA